MNKKLVMASIGLMVIFGLSACSSDYVMTTRSGEVIVSKEKPELDAETGMTKYVDLDGNEHQISSDQISEMVEK